MARMAQMIPGIFFLLISVLMSTDVLASSNRTALVIGNASYQMMPLDNPVNDARAITEVLKEADFQVISVFDADLQAMQSAMLQFTASLNSDSTALVYYAGHGIQSNGRNYLLPVDAKLESERALRFEGMLLNDILEELDLSGARTKLVILDACRNNPFERSTRGGSRGLAAVDAAQGTLIAYATAPGATAADGEGENGLYTGSLIKAMREPGLKVEEVFKQTRINVAAVSGGDQVPWESSSLTGDLVFIEGDVNIGAQVATQDRESIFWQSIESSSDPRMFEAYLAQYPDGAFSRIAELKLSMIAEPAASPDQLVEVAAVDAVIEEPEPRAPDLVGQCDDLSGIWGNQVTGKALCVPEKLAVENVGNNQYKLHGKGCGIAMSGSGEFQDNRFTVKWKQSPCTGSTNYVVDNQCQLARGPVKVNVSLLCKNIVGEAILTRLTGEHTLDANTEEASSSRYDSGNK